MAFVIARPCVGVKDTACVVVCPVDVIHPTKEEPEFNKVEQLFIDPVDCIHCGLCVGDARCRRSSRRRMCRSSGRTSLRGMRNTTVAKVRGEQWFAFCLRFSISGQRIAGPQATSRPGLRSRQTDFDAQLCYSGFMSTHAPKAENVELPPDAKIAIVAARFNAHIVDELLAGCLERLKQANVDESRVPVHRVPGAFELPVAAKMLARTKNFDAIICLGCVIRGETPHFDYVAGECARGIMQVGLEEALPVIFGVLTTDTEQQARDRIGGKHGHSGERAAEAAVEMIAMARQMRR
jgi:6,7-dimethyl-8-ribityllumazine synthase